MSMVVRTQLIRPGVALLLTLTLAGIALLSSHPKAAEVTTLPNGWRVAPNAAAILPLGTLPLQIAQDLSGRWLAISNAGFGDLSIDIVSEQTGKIVSTQPMARTFFGLAFSPSGDALYASTAADGAIGHFAFDSSTGALSDYGAYGLGAGRIWVNGIAVTLDGATVLAAVAGANSLVGVNSKSGATIFAAPVGNTPYDVVLSRDGSKAFVSNWGGASVSVVNVAQGQVVATIPTDDHPGAMLLANDGRTLYVACANQNVVDVIDTLTNRASGKIDVGLYPRAPIGATPNGLAQSTDGRVLFVSDADSNAVVAVDVTSTAPTVFGAIPVGWYPTDIAMSRDGHRLYVLDGRGLSGHANPDKTQSDITPRGTGANADPYYAPNLMTGDLETITALDRNTLSYGLTLAQSYASYRPDYAAHAPALPPFKHVVYVIKENRTYDQVLGDDPRGNGQASLAVFGARITPNARRLADEFVLLDNFDSDGIVSADGHEWADAAYATDYVQRMWPADYAGRSNGFFDFGGAIDAPTAGYLWDAALRRNVSVRLYGEGAAAVSFPPRALHPSAQPLLDPAYHPFDLTISDQDRVVEWLREFRHFEQSGGLPQLEIVWLPSDHTAALKPGARAPYAMVADNDYALGRMVEALSHSRYWKDTLLVSIEDDAQAGPDHVSDQRMPAYVVSAFSNRGLVSHTHYTTSSVLRTIELILGLPPMSQFDAGATPLSDLFSAAPNTLPWKASSPNVSLVQTNPPGGPGARASEQLDLRSADASDPAEFNRILLTYLR
jgi:YVTN family beta-propeller protein